MKDSDMFYEGKISSKNILQPIDSASIIDRIKNDRGIRGQVFLLRKVLQVDKKAYSRQKARLPFFIGAEFSNHNRKLENLIKVNALVLDIDNCFQDLPFVGEIIDSLRNDNRLLMLFKSPSNNGLKLIFLLDKPICSASIYSEFYR